MNADILVVTFPGKINFLIANIWPLIMFSCLFTLIIILGVAYTVHVVFKQKKLAEIKNDFINNMTHEFKTPIATIGIATDTLKNPKVFGNKEKLDFYTGIIKQENERMNNQVNKVLQMAQIDKGELTFKYDEVDADAIINKVVNGVQLQLQEKQGTITITNQAISTTINADSTHFANVINNLIDNALKYSPDKPVIKIKLWNEKEALAICVSDNGIGMNEETQKRIFETFYRAPTGNIHNVKGFGLGLSYVKAIIDDMKGEIEVKSEPGKGSTFIVTLPLLAPKKTDKEQELINA
jgi:signal transduction histidine kinase